MRICAYSLHTSRNLHNAKGCSSGEPHSRRTVARVQSAAQESIEHEKCPNGRTVVARARDVPRDEMLKIRPVEVSRFGEWRAEQGSAHALTQRPPEPFGERHCDAPVGPIKHPCRHKQISQ